VNDSVRDWQWFGLDGITKDNGHGLMDGMPKSGTTLGGYRRDQPLPIAFSRQPVGSIDVLSMKDCYGSLIFKVHNMTAVRLSRLTRPGVFESIAPKRLFELLQPFTDFFANRSVLIESPDSIDCQAVIREITKADRETPADLLDAICLIDELANTVAIELLLDRIPAHTLGIELGGKHSAADIVTAAWLTDDEDIAVEQAE
jgi:hypothetical protein